MLRQIIGALYLLFALPGLAQSPGQNQVTLPQDPRAILAAAAPHYNFFDPALKPWHLKATYQLYDFQGKPSEQGTWEFWWASAKVYRSSFHRGGISSTMWATSDGSIYRKETGGPPRYFEGRLKEIVLREVPDINLIGSPATEPKIKVIGNGPTSLTCIESNLQGRVNSAQRMPPQQAPGLYCFDLTTGALRATFLEDLLTQYSQHVELQGKYFARQISVQIEKQLLLTVSVESIEEIPEMNSVFDPPADASKVNEIAHVTQSGQSATKVEVGSLVKKVTPEYPPMAKSQRIQGIVRLGCTIGTDGKVHDIDVLAAPSPLLVEAAVDAVKHWEYKPTTLGGKPIKIETIINVVFSLGN